MAGQGIGPGIDALRCVTDAALRRENYFNKLNDSSGLGGKKNLFQGAVVL